MPDIIKMQSSKRKKSAGSTVMASEAVEFPSARYFQVHFEHIYAELVETRRSLEDLQQQLLALTSLQNKR